jgi:D-glycero-D-manno-heptose 1,7-bisphosphate phosphatase
MQKALFLDRDGVINREIGNYVFTQEQFIWQEGIFDVCRFAKSKGYLLIVITNQGGISKGIYTIQDTEKLHDYMTSVFESEGCPLTDIYYSPYHKDISTNILSKPSSLMLEKACSKYNIDAKLSFMIGDRPRDIVCGKRIGCRTIGISEEAKAAEPDYWSRDILGVQTDWFV